MESPIWYVFQIMMFSSYFFFYFSKLPFRTASFEPLNIFHITDVSQDHSPLFFPFMNDTNFSQSKYNITYAIPIHNKAKYLNSCLEQLYNQTDPNFEMVFVDDGSTDESFDILWKRVHNDSRITIIRHNYNLGTFYSRFNSALYSKTKYYIGMDTDDILQPYAVQKMNEIVCIIS